MTELSVRPIVRSPLVTFELDAENGLFHLVAPDGGRLAENLECVLRTKDQVIRSRGCQTVCRPAAGGDGIEIQFNAGQPVGMGLQVRADLVSGGLRLRLSIRNESHLLRPIEAAILGGDSARLPFAIDLTECSVLTQGCEFNEDASAVPASPEQFASGPVESHLVGGIGNRRTARYLILGFDGATRHLGLIRTRSNGSGLGVEVVAIWDQAELHTGASLTSHDLWIGSGPSVSSLVQSYHRATAAPLSRRLPVVWDSWHVDYQDTTEAQILESLGEVRSRFPEIDTIVIGDGYQKVHMDGPGIGDWLETNNRFPHGLGWLSDQIRKKGFKPGIWIAPFLIGEKSQFYKYYADALVRTREGTPGNWWEMWRGDRAAYLDTTHPDARNFLRDVFEHLSFRFGFEYFQVDFAYAAAADGFRRDPTVTRAEALHRGLETIRKTIGDNRTLVLAGAPPGAGGGVADAVRSGPDTGPEWNARCGPGLVVQNLLARSAFVPGSVAASAPVLVSEGTTADAGFRSLVTAIGLTGGPLSLSGPLKSLSTEQAELLRKILPASGAVATPVDLFSRPWPQVVSLAVGHYSSPAWIVGVFNTGDAPARREISFQSLGAGNGPHHVYEFWEHRYSGSVSNTLTIEDMPPRSCHLFAIHPDRGAPQILSASDQLLQGARTVHHVDWRPATSSNPARLSVELRHHGAVRTVLSIAVPEGLIARSVVARTGRARITRERSSGRLLAIETSFRDRADFDILF